MINAVIVIWRKCLKISWQKVINDVFIKKKIFFSGQHQNYNYTLYTCITNSNLKHCIEVAL